MQPGILITNNKVGNHDPEAWAMATAEQVVPTKEIPSDRALAGRQLQIAVAVALVDHHTDVQKTHQSALNTQGSAYLWQPYDTTEHVDAAVATIQAAAKGTYWESHYNDPEVLHWVRDVLATHFNTSHHVDLSAHCDKNPNDADAQIWKAQHHPGQDLVEEPDGTVWMKSRALEAQWNAGERRRDVNGTGDGPVSEEGNISGPVEQEHAAT